jgi:hypothetical protein
MIERNFVGALGGAQHGDDHADDRNNNNNADRHHDAQANVIPTDVLSSRARLRPLHGHKSPRRLGFWRPDGIRE